MRWRSETDDEAAPLGVVQVRRLRSRKRPFVPDLVLVHAPPHVDLDRGPCRTAEGTLVLLPYKRLCLYRSTALCIFCHSHGGLTWVDAYRVLQWKDIQHPCRLWYITHDHLTWVDADWVLQREEDGEPRVHARGVVLGMRAEHHVLQRGLSRDGVMERTSGRARECVL